jgi:hypothetical protein
MSDEHMHFSPAQAFMLAIGEARLGGAQAELERIVKLLDDADSKYDWHHDCRLCEAIDLLTIDDD